MGRPGNQHDRCSQGSEDPGIVAPDTKSPHNLAPLRHTAHIPSPCGSPESGIPVVL